MILVFPVLPTNIHDLHLADKILKLVLKEAEKNNAKRIKSIQIQLGEISEHGQTITPENLKFNFSLLAKNTIAEKAELKINKTKGEKWQLTQMDIEK